MKVKKSDLKGQIADFPIEVVQRMCECQVEQGNKFDPKVFQVLRTQSRCFDGKGFDWYVTSENSKFWGDVIIRKNFDIFFDKYPKKALEPVTMYIGQTYPHKEYPPSKQEMFREFALNCDMYIPPINHGEVKWVVEDTPQTTSEPKVESFSARDVDFAYLAGVFNVSGIDGLHNEIKRLKEIGKEPHEIILTSRKYD